MYVCVCVWRERESLEDAMLLVLNLEKLGLMSKEWRWPLDAGKDKEVDSTLDIPERMQPCLYHDFETSDLYDIIIKKFLLFRLLILW